MSTDEKRSQIEERARQIWQREGRPEGRAEAHWKQAEEELAREAAGQAATTEQPAPYVPTDEGMIEAAVDSPVVAGAAVPSSPPVPAAEAEERKAVAAAEGSAPYVPSEESIIEPASDAPVVAGAAAVSEPPMPAAGVQERNAAPPAETAKFGAAKTANSTKPESKNSHGKHADDRKGETKKGSSKKKG